MSRGPWRPAARAWIISTNKEGCPLEEQRVKPPDIKAAATPTAGLLEQASLWWVRLRDEDLPPEEISRWLDWCQSDPAHLEAFEKVESLGGRLAALDPAARAAMVRELLDEPAPSRRPAARGARGWRPGWSLATGLALAAGMAAVLLGGSLLHPLHAPQAAAQSVSFVTRKAQGRDVSLADGSRVAIGAESSLAVDYTAASRNLQLRSGEAYFEVEHNPQRPFVVRAGRLKVTAVGTAFDIRKTGDRIEVVVTHGVVDVADAAGPVAGGQTPLPKDGVIRVAAGQLVVAGGDSPSLTVRPADRDAATSWRKGSMSFLDEGLGVVVANLNRYSGTEVRIADPSLDGLRYTGTVVQGHEQEWLAAIQKVFPVTARPAADGSILLYRRAEVQQVSGV
jgi:transmembrane sensor